VDLIDNFGRTVRDLRISVTDRCNFRCTYCMPAEGMKWLDRSEVLTFEEIERVARICVERFDVNSLRLTGGEPTVRAHLPRLVSKLAALRLSNGEKPDIAGIAEAQLVGFTPMKVNVVVERGANDDEILDLVAYGRDNNIEIRFIEFMPLDATNEWERKKVVTQDEIISVISAQYPLEILPARGAAPADRWRFVDGKGTVGVIPSVSHPFCADCDRVRLTSDGQFRTCLFATDEFDIRALLRNGGTDDEIAELMRKGVGLKWAGHQINQVNFIRPRRSMSQIGG
jgi:cyclic pyranopterin phosphate synthase